MIGDRPPTQEELAADQRKRTRLQDEEARCWLAWRAEIPWLFANLGFGLYVIFDYLFWHVSTSGPRTSVKLLIAFVIIHALCRAMIARDALNAAAWDAWWFDNSAKFLRVPTRRRYGRNVRTIRAIERACEALDTPSVTPLRRRRWWEVVEDIGRRFAGY